MCHSDSVTVQGLLPGTTYPRVPGLEVIGMVEAIGPDVAGWDVGMRVGVSVGSVVRAGTAPAAAAVVATPTRTQPSPLSHNENE